MKLGISFTMGFKGINTISDFLAFAYKKELAGVELVAEPPFCFIDNMNDKDVQDIKKQAANFGLELSLHATFSDVNISAYNPNVRNYFLNLMKQNIDFSQKIGSEIVTIHPGELSAAGASFPDDVKRLNFESFQFLAKYAEKKFVKIGYENMPIMTWSQMEESYTPILIQSIVDKINSKSLGITWDVGHSKTTEFSMEGFANSFKGNLVHVHIHDNTGPGKGWVDKHLEIGKGTIDWSNLLGLIKKLDYRGVLIMELDNCSKIENSLEYLKNL